MPPKLAKLKSAQASEGREVVKLVAKQAVKLVRIDRRVKFVT
jgi:hypothetical protein